MGKNTEKKLIIFEKNLFALKHDLMRIKCLISKKTVKCKCDPKFNLIYVVSPWKTSGMLKVTLV